MSNITKKQLEEALKQCLLQKPFDKITISDLTEACGISRMTFYYHFKDIYDLVEYSCEEDGKKALQNQKTYDTWQNGLLHVFDAVRENKPFILNVYHNVSREQTESYLNTLTYGLLERVVEEQAEGMDISSEDKAFIIRLYTYSFVGVMLDWVKNGMKEDPDLLVERMSMTLHGSIANSVNNFSGKKE